MLPECDADEDAADGQVPLVEGGIGGEQDLFAQIDHPETRRSDEADAGPRDDIAQPVFAGEAVRARFTEAGGEHGHDRDARSAALLDGSNGRLGRQDDIDVLGDFRECGQRRISALAQHFAAAVIDRIDSTWKSRLGADISTVARRSCSHRSTVRSPQPNAGRKSRGAASALRRYRRPDAGWLRTRPIAVTSGRSVAQLFLPAGLRPVEASCKMGRHHSAAAAWRPR